MPTSIFRDAAGVNGGRGQLAGDISEAVVQLFADNTGRGPPRARTTIDDNLIVVLMHDSMTTAEKTLVHAGREAEVLRVRRVFQEEMRPALIAAVERLTKITVLAFMSTNHTNPDTAAEIFVMDRAV